MMRRYKDENDYDDNDGCAPVEIIMMIVHKGEGNPEKYFARESPTHWDLPLLGLGVTLIIIYDMIDDSYLGLSTMMIPIMMMIVMVTMMIVMT